MGTLLSALPHRMLIGPLQSDVITNSRLQVLGLVGLLGGVVFFGNKKDKGIL